MTEKSPFARIEHIGVIVRDMDKAIEYYQSLGIGPFERLRNVTAVQSKVSGKPVDFQGFGLKIAFAKIGLVALELIQPGEKESIWKEFLDTYGEGISHLCFTVDDIGKEEAELERKGFRILFSMRFQNGGGAAYVETRNVGGVIFEIVQRPANSE